MSTLSSKVKALGDEEKAIDFHKRLHDLWRDADSELQPMVKDARESLGSCSWLADVNQRMT